MQVAGISLVVFAIIMRVNLRVGRLGFVRYKFRTSRRALNVLFARAGLSAVASKAKPTDPS